jgi:hypothetical protein
MAETGWRRPFDDEIVLPEGRILRTLGDAGRYMRCWPPRPFDEERTAAGRLRICTSDPQKDRETAFAKEAGRPRHRCPVARGRFKGNELLCPLRQCPLGVCEAHPERP